MNIKSYQRQIQVRLSSAVKIGGLFRINDPSEGLGSIVPSFSLYQTYEADRSRVQEICNRLYVHVFDKINEGSLGDARSLLRKYSQKVSSVHDSSKAETIDSRPYIVLTRNTARGTQATILMRFYGYGAHLYLGIDAYVLGGTNWVKFIRKLIFTCIFFLAFGLLMGVFNQVTLSMYQSGQFGYVPSLGSQYWLLPVILVLIYWSKLIEKILKFRGHFLFAIRQAFSKESDIHSFNLDDITMFFKSSLHVGVYAVREVLADEGFEASTLDAFVQSINVNNIFEESVSTVIGSVEGSVISGNKV